VVLNAVWGSALARAGLSWKPVPTARPPPEGMPKVHAEVASPPHDTLVVDGARDELHRLALNLIENALRHTPPGTHVQATLASVGDDVVLTVEDDGPGIPEELRPRLFERFVRGRGDRGGGSGLGLAIVRAVAESHGGSVAVERAPAGGARFVVRLPQTSTTTGSTIGRRLSLS